MVLRKTRQQNRSQRGAEQPHRKLHEAVGIVEPGHAAGDQERREDVVDDEAQLSDRNAEHGRRHLPQHASYALVLKIQPKSGQQLESRELRHLKCELQDPADENRPGKCGHGRIEVRREPQRENEGRH
jgi:hypothetical protein